MSRSPSELPDAEDPSPVGSDDAADNPPPGHANQRTTSTSVAPQLTPQTRPVIRPAPTRKSAQAPSPLENVEDTPVPPSPTPRRSLRSVFVAVPQPSHKRPLSSGERSDTSGVDDTDDESHFTLTLDERHPRFLGLRPR